jgi:hypothetical protein
MIFRGNSGQARIEVCELLRESRDTVIQHVPAARAAPQERVFAGAGDTKPAVHVHEDTVCVRARTRC